MQGMCQWCHRSYWDDLKLKCGLDKAEVGPTFTCKKYEREPGADDNKLEENHEL